jgi:transposase InsO family protein
MIAEVMGVQTRSLRRYLERMDKEPPPAGRKKTGRPLAVPAEVRLKIRNRYIESYKQWGAAVLADWARREGLGNYSASTISKVIEDIKEKKPKKEKPRRYEITASDVMWSEDGAGFKERGRKKELLLLQDECSRYKINARLVDGPAKAEDVCSYLREAFEKHGAPLILKHDGDSIFNAEQVEKLLDEYQVISLTSPPHYPPFNGKMERSIRDVKSYEKAMRRYCPTSRLATRIESAIHDLNETRPRPVLKGRTAAEAHATNRTLLPDRQKLRREVARLEKAFLNDSPSRKQLRHARRKAIEQVLSRQGLLKELTDVSTYLHAKTGTN